MKETQRIAILTDLFVGFRVGELLALEIADLDLERQTLRINKNLIRVKTEALSLDNPNIRILNYDPKKKTHLIVQSTPKTKTSNREIAISDGLCELLIRHLYTLAHSSWPNPDNLLFPSRAGTHIDPKRSDSTPYQSDVRSKRLILMLCGTHWQRGWWRNGRRSTLFRGSWDTRPSRQQGSIFTRARTSNGRRSPP